MIKEYITKFEYMPINEIFEVSINLLKSTSKTNSNIEFKI